MEYPANWSAIMEYSLQIGRFEDFCREIEITQLFSSVEHPQTNGLAETTNKVILTGLNKRLEQVKGLWTYKLHVVL